MLHDRRGIQTASPRPSDLENLNAGADLLQELSCQRDLTAALCESSMKEGT